MSESKGLREFKLSLWIKTIPLWHCLLQLKGFQVPYFVKARTLVNGRKTSSSKIDHKLNPQNTPVNPQGC